MQDALLNSNKELDVQAGDFLVGESTVQHQELLIVTQKGEWKESPLVAVGASNYLKDEDEAGFLGEVKKQLEKDGMKVASIDFDNGKLSVDAAY